MTLPYFVDKPPSQWLLDRIHFSVLSPDLLEGLNTGVDDMPFVFDHVGGQGTNSPRRGVCVQAIPFPGVEEGHWTLTQNKSNCTLTSRVVDMHPGLLDLVPMLCDQCRAFFPECPLNDASFSLFVANKYVPGYKHAIVEHKDDQEWYPSPPVFASVTYFPDGEPEPCRTFRFQVYDESDSTWKHLHLTHASVCLMRADIQHRVKPPLSCPLEDVKGRINFTFRNLMCPFADPFGYLVGISNHFRYYGVPERVTVPLGFPTKTISEIIDKLRNLNPEMDVVEDTRDRITRSVQKKKLRAFLEEAYEQEGAKLNTKMAGKSNIVLELLESSRDFM
jgi:hypothetical protein